MNCPHCKSRIVGTVDEISLAHILDEIKEGPRIEDAANRLGYSVSGIYKMFHRLGIKRTITGIIEARRLQGKLPL